jgi:hypothetical protein
VFVDVVGAGVLTWDVAHFPLGDMTVEKLPGRPGEAEDVVLRWSGEALHDSIEFRRHQARAEVQLGLGVFAAGLSGKLSCLKAPADYFRVVEAPKKKVVLLQDMKREAREEEQLVLLPLTNAFKVRPYHAATWLDSGVKVRGTEDTAEPESVVLEHPHYNKVQLAQHPRPEPFWFVRRVSSDEEKDQANMAVTYLDMRGGSTARVPGLDKCAPPFILEFRLPVMVLTKDVAKDEELVCWWPGPGAWGHRK